MALLTGNAEQSFDCFGQIHVGNGITIAAGTDEAASMIGVGLGLAVALAGGRLIEALLYNVSPRDPVVIGVVTLLLTAVALVACWLPARRAARLSPLEALRTD